MKDRTLLVANIILGLLFVLGVSLMFAGEGKADGIIRHMGFPEDSIVQSYVQYAYEISGGDMDFVTMLEAENGLWNPQRQSEVPDGYGPGGKEDSWGFCQLHRRWHSGVVDDPRFKSDPYWQLDQCYKKYVGGTTFYGYFVRHKVRNRFSFNGSYAPKKKHLTVEQSIPTTVNTYMKAKNEQQKLDRLAREYAEQETKARKAWRFCMDSGECLEK